MIMFNPPSDNERNKQFINIRDASRNYATAFWLEDGKNLSVIRPDGTKDTRRCKFIDPYHFNFGTVPYHTAQFADFLHKNNLRCEPEAYVTDLRFYKKAYVDRTLMDAAGKYIPYYGIIGSDSRDKLLQAVAVCPDTVIGRQVCFWDGIGPGKQFCSVDQALSELVPSLKLSEHEQKLLHAVLFEMGKQIPRVTQQEYDAIGEDYKGVYSNFDGKHPEWAGKRTAFLPGHGTTLFIEDVSFIIESGKKPTLSAQVKAAAATCEGSNKPFEKRSEPAHNR